VSLCPPSWGLLLTKCSLAFHEMRLVLASVLFRFDLELCDKTEEWMAQETHILSLNVSHVEAGALAMFRWQQSVEGFWKYVISVTLREQ
jgi:hypothetical protein